MARHPKAKKVALGVGSLVTKVAPYVAFLQQLTEKDVAVLPANRTYQQQGKDLVNIITGRMGGFHLFNAPSDYKPPFTINPGAIINSKWVQGGVGMIIYGLVGKAVNKKAGREIVPKAGKIGKIGGKLAFGGGVGALFDAPTATAPNSTSNYIAPAPAGSQTSYSTANWNVQTYNTTTMPVPVPMSTGLGS